MADEKRLIYMDDTMDKLRAYAERKHQAGHTEIANGILKAVNYIHNEIKRVDAVPVVHSQWDTVFYERNGTLASYSHLCPVCKYFYRDIRFKGHNYCPNCGAKMDGDGNA